MASGVICHHCEVRSSVELWKMRGDGTCPNCGTFQRHAPLPARPPVPSDLPVPTGTPLPTQPPDDRDESAARSRSAVTPARVVGRVLQVLFAAWMVLIGLLIATDLTDLQWVSRLGELTISRTLGIVETRNNRVEILGIVFTVMFAITGLAFIAWTWLVRGALTDRESAHRYGRGWAIGAWFVPIVNLWRPKQVIDDLWRAADRDEDAPPGVRPSTTARVIHLWWAVLLGSFALGIVAASVSPDGISGRGEVAWSLAVNSSTVVAAVLAGVVVTSFQSRLRALAEAQHDETGRPAWLRTAAAYSALAGATIITGFALWNEALPDNESTMPAALGGVPRIDSGIALELQGALDAIGPDSDGRRWRIAYYSDDDRLYRALVSDSAPAEELNDDELHAAIGPGDAVFVIEGGFDGDLTRAVTETRRDVRYLCYPGFAGDEFERQLEMDPVAICIFQGEVLGLLVTQEDLSTDEELRSLMNVAEELHTKSS